MRGSLTISALLAAVPAAAASPDTCDTYVGQSVTLNPFDAVAGVLKEFPKQKDEYETTTQFEARVANARSSIPDKVIIPGIFSPNSVSYNADAGTLRVQSYALRNLNADYAPVFGYGTPYYRKIPFGIYANKDVVVSQQETSTGTYIGSNAYGASVTVTRITRVQNAIFDNKNADSKSGLFLETGPDNLIGELTMSIPEARSIKAAGKVAFVISPRWPYYAEATKYWEPNITSRVDVTNPIHVIVGDIQCGLLLTSDDRVVGAFATR